jgi:hypothetical protein
MSREEEMAGADVFFHNAVLEASVAKALTEKLEQQCQNNKSADGGFYSTIEDTASTGTTHA